VGRSYHSIYQLEQLFSYAELVGLVANHHLPLVVRAAFCTLLTYLYVDRYPHDNLRLPETIQALRCADGHIEDGALSWTQPEAIPHYTVHPSNAFLRTHPQEHYSHPDCHKFELLQQFIQAYFSVSHRRAGGGGGGGIAIARCGIGHSVQRH
jgi:hypothetical protein